MALYQHRYGGHTAAGTNWMFSWWADSGGSIDTVHAAGESWINTFWTGNFGTAVAAAVGVDQVLTALIAQSTGKQQEKRESGSTLSGTAVGNQLPPDVAIVVSLRTQLANRSGRGRMYLPHTFVGTLTAQGRLNASTQDDLITWLTAAWSGYTVGTPVVYSRLNRTTQAITSFDVGDLFDTVRHRDQALLEARDSAAMP
jgi:hypothetical protein